jgi:hypothetical protein
MSEVNVGIGTLCNVEASFDGVNLNVNVEVCPAGAEFTQIQSDWNQSDNTAVDYIKNKPAIAVSRVGVNLTGSGTVLDPLKFQAVDWAAETLYRTLQLIIYEGELYRVTTEFTSGATFDATNLERIEPKVATPVTPDYTAITVGDKLQEVAEKVAGLQTLSEILSTSIINQEIYHRKVEEIARVTILLPTYSGTIIYVSTGGNNTNDGLTVGTAKKTIGGAISAVANGGIIQMVDGAYDLVDEDLGYLYVNTSKTFQIRGNASDRSLVKITATGAAYHIIRMSVSGGILWQDLTIEAGKNLPLIRTDLDKSVHSVWCKNVHFNFTSGGTGAKFFRATNADINGVDVRDFVFENCLFTSASSLSLAAMDFVNTGVNIRVLILNCEFETTTIPILENSTKAKYYVYDNTIVINGNAVAVRFGEDTVQPTHIVGLVDCRNNTITYGSGFGQHGILIGRGTADVYCVNNRIVMDNINNASVIGMVIKSTPDELGKSYIAGNYITSRRGIYIKGGTYNTIELNYAYCYDDGFCFETEDPTHEATLLSRNNVVRKNIFYGGTGVNLRTATSKESMESGIMNNNRFYLGDNKIYLYATQTEWENKSDFWNLDNFSILLDYTNLPINTDSFV